MFVVSHDSTVYSPLTVAKITGVPISLTSVISRVSSYDRTNNKTRIHDLFLLARFLGRLLRVESRCLSVRPYVRPSVRPQNVSLIRMEFGRWMMLDVPYAIWPDPRSSSRSRGVVRHSSIFKIYLVRHFQWQLANDYWFLISRKISKFDRAGFLMSLLQFLCRVTLNLEELGPPCILCVFAYCNLLSSS